MTPDTRCPHYRDARCLAASCGIANRVFATGFLCRDVCRRMHGPHGDAAKKPSREFLRAVFKSTFCSVGEARFLKATRQKHRDARTVRVPVEWPAIKRDLHLLLSSEGVLSALLTGSTIYGEHWSRKDVDVNLMVDSPATYARVMKQRPERLAGIRCDIFPYTRPNLFYPTLDCDRGIVYLPKRIPWPNLALASGLAATVDESDDETDAILSDLIVELERETRPT